MKITNSSIETLGGASGPSSAGGISDSAARYASLRSSGQADSVSLSSAGLLLNLAKATAPAPNANKLASVAALVRSGQYQSNTDGVSTAVVQGHLR